MQQVLVIVVSYKSASEVTRCLEGLSGSEHKAFRVAVCETAVERRMPS